MPGPYPQIPTPIEALCEYDVQEILLDGREILEKPPTPTEYFQKVLNRIDFSKSYDDEACSNQTEKTSVDEQYSFKVWNNVREASRMALTELNAFVDVLTIIKEEKYISVFPVVHDIPESNRQLFLVGKKRALSSAADILLKGAERLRQRHSELADARSRMMSENKIGSISFHQALMQLRREWRLRLHQNAILGDVSLRSVGSRFRETGNFEIRQRDAVTDQNATTYDPASSIEVVFSRSIEALLADSFDSDINVTFHETDVDSGPTLLWNLLFNSHSGEFTNTEGSSRFPKVPLRVNPRERLAKTQRLLACREILSILAYEASASKGVMNLVSEAISFVSQDQIVINLFPGVQVVISLPSKPPQRTPEFPSSEVKVSSPQFSMDKKSTRKSGFVATHDVAGSLSLQFHRLLAAEHQGAWSNLVSLPQSACGPVQIPSRCRAAGAHALTAIHFTRCGRDGSWFSVPVASVAGFAGPAAAAWSNLNPSLKPTSSAIGDRSAFSVASAQRLPSASITQDRLALFTEWGSLQSSSVIPQASTGFTNTANPFDDSVHGTAKVHYVEHQLIKRRAGDRTIQSVTGSSASILERCIKLCRHYYLRRKVFEVLTDFCSNAPIRMIVHWDGINSALLTSARLCFYVTNYDAYRSWLGLSVTHSGIMVFYPDPPRTFHVGTDLSRLHGILKNQVVYTQLHVLDVLITKILGWTRLGNNPFSGIACPSEIGDGPLTVKMYASPSDQRCICIQAGPSVGARLFVTGSVSESCFPPFEQCVVTRPPYNQRFREVDLTAIPAGPHVVTRIETVISLLT